MLTLSVPSCPALGARCWRRNETPTLQSGLNLFTFTLCFLQLLYFISFAQQSTGQVAKHYDSATIQCAGTGRDNLYLNLFTAAKTLFWGTFYQLRIRFVPGSVPFEESEKHLVCKKCFFPMETNRGFLAEHLVCKNVQPWLRVLFASTSQPSLYLVPYSGE